MRIATKRELTADQIREFLRHGLGPRATLDDYHEINDGSFAAVYALDLTDGRRLVLKVAPQPGLRLMRYEVDLMHIEIEFYRLAGAAGVPLPKLHAADPDLGYLLIDRLGGQSLDTVRQAMTPAQLERLRRELGGICTQLHTVSGPLFGYPRRDGRTRSPSWRTSFLTIVDDVLADAVEYRRELPAPAPAIGKLINRHAGLLDDVTTPTLVHFDLWDGNVFVTRGGDTARVAGLIDGERAFFGDPGGGVRLHGALPRPGGGAGTTGRVRRRQPHAGQADRHRAAPAQSLHHVPLRDHGDRGCHPRLARSGPSRIRNVAHREARPPAGTAVCPVIQASLG
jgi:aminoglycoside phosphotransferase (APT) family kinase protein